MSGPTQSTTPRATPDNMPDSSATQVPDNTLKLPERPRKDTALEEATPEKAFQKAQKEIRGFADELKCFVDSKESLVISGTLVSEKPPYESVNIAFAIKDLKTNSSALRSLYDGDTNKLTSSISFKPQADTPPKKEELKVLGLDESTVSAENLKGEVRLTLRGAGHLRKPHEKELDLKLPEGGHLDIWEGSVKLKDGKTLELKDCRLYSPKVHEKK